MKNKKINWKFKALNPVDYELDIYSNIENRLIMYIFGKAKRKIARTKNINVKGNISDINVINIPPMYYNLLKTILNPVCKAAVKSTKEDGIEILNFQVISAKFIRSSIDWDVNITFGGQYVDKR